jgi:hypothetical protein
MLNVLENAGLLLPEAVAENEEVTISTSNVRKSKIIVRDNFVLGTCSKLKNVLQNIFVQTLLYVSSGQICLHFYHLMQFFLKYLCKHTNNAYFVNYTKQHCNDFP